MIVGFTGTRKGMSRHQFRMFRTELKKLTRKGINQFHHGDCLGADADAHRLAVDLEIPIIVIHPPINPRHRAYCSGVSCEILPPKEYIERNHAIVNACDVLFVVPETKVEQQRSGTWATYRYAKKTMINRSIIVITG